MGGRAAAEPARVVAGGRGLGFGEALAGRLLGVGVTAAAAFVAAATVGAVAETVGAGVAHAVSAPAAPDLAQPARLVASSSSGSTP
ncbi:hypothetical protein EAD98_14790 [Micromonospora sp. CV4]|nr:hypothetical protein EAD98_14790 [Micromonospora sp. CV4]